MSQISGLLLDSDVLAEIRKTNPDLKVVAYLRRNSFRTLYVSVLSLGELKGLYPYPETERWLGELMDRFGEHVLEVDTQVALEWAGRSAQEGTAGVGSQQTTPLPTAALEGLMCATAQVYHLEIVSSKAEQYKKWGVKATNPFIEG